MAVKDALGGTDVEKIKDSTEALVNASHTFTQRLYEQASASQSGGAASTSGPSDDGANASDDEVVDAEIVDEPGMSPSSGPTGGGRGPRGPAPGSPWAWPGHVPGAPVPMSRSSPKPPITVVEDLDDLLDVARLASGASSATWPSASRPTSRIFKKREPAAPAVRPC